MWSSMFLAISSSIDALGIGITYGIKNTKISLGEKIILFIILFIVTCISIFVGDFIQALLPTFITDYLSNFILIGIGTYICFSALKTGKDSKNIFNDPSVADLNNSKTIEPKEASLLAFALALDSFCLGTCGAITDMDLSFFPLFVASFHVLFLFLGTYFGTRIRKSCRLPQNTWSIISGILLICISIFEFF